MPYINIWERDESGINVADNETIVFVPGDVAVTDPSVIDDNGCILIRPATGDDEYENIPAVLSTNEYIKTLIHSGLTVLYKNIDLDSSFDLDFLNDKNSYDIKFLTLGGHQLFTYSDDSYFPGLDTSVALPFIKIAAKRGDCAVIGAMSTNNIVSDTAIADLKEAIKNLSLNDSSDDSTDIGSFASVFCSKMIENDSSDSSDDSGFSIKLPYDINTYPDLAYLQAYGEAVKNNNTWEALANSARGTVASFDIDSTISKYDLDIAMDKAGRSFNGLIKLRPSNQAVIWGDRTLLSNDKKGKILNVKATSFLSIRNMISDISKRAYNSAVRCTFETNNDVTWVNFKSGITALLDEMVADYKLANYKIIKKPSANRAEIKCEIHVSPYGPVEDFDIGIVITNTDVETTIE